MGSDASDQEGLEHSSDLPERKLESEQLNRHQIEGMGDAAKHGPEMERADRVLRFVNFVVDLGVLYGVASLYEIVVVALDFDVRVPIGGGPMHLSVTGVIRVLVLAIAYAIPEFLFGKTLGKLLTRTHVVCEDGSRPTFWRLLGRNAARFIPFEPISNLGDPPKGWHDTMSRTIVVEDRSE